MRTLFVLVFIFVSTTNILAQAKVLLQSLEKMRSGYINDAIVSLENEADKGDIRSQFVLGLCYENGYGVIPNNNKAFKLYRKTAESGLAIGQYCVSICYRKGIGTPINNEKADYWEKKSRNKYDPELLNLVSTYYQEGLKNLQNYAIDTNTNKDLVSNNMKSDKIDYNYNTAINITYAAPLHISKQTGTTTQTTQRQDSQSDVDINIPRVKVNNENSFVIILANENYRREAPVPYAINDGEIFRAYCINVLGIPEQNIKYNADASLNDFKYNLNWLSQVLETYKGEGKAIFYYAGHGISDEKQKTTYLLPIDGYGSDVSTAYDIDELYKTLGKLPSKFIAVFLDACFSGSKRGGGMLTYSRSVAIKAKKSNPVGNMVVFSAAQEDETAHFYKEQKHGMFTYYLLKKLQETKGDVTMGELADYITSNVKKRSIVVNGKIQTPVVRYSDKFIKWHSLYLR